MEQLERMLIGENCFEKGPKTIFHNKPRITVDKYFGDDQVIDCDGQKCFVFIHTVRRDCLPFKLPNSAFHKQSATAKNQCTRVARVLPQTTVVKTLLVYTKDGLSFLSTGPTDLSCVNSDNANQHISSAKSCGGEINKREWVVEMNDPKQLYLVSNGRTYTIDQQIESCKIFYKTYKYWLVSKNRALSLACVVADEKYLECATDPDAVKVFGSPEKFKPPIFRQFCNKLTVQGRNYEPVNYH